CLPSFEMLLNCLENDEQSGDNEEQLWKASSQQRMSARQLRRLDLPAHCNDRTALRQNKKK
ncbi:MAG: hypothetical protein Q4D64_13955, partial [Prevotellaceae bacterium]|nr:hypothetical protein [Prevotellaceae bacterium]